MAIAGILLAGGRSSRFGTDKRLARLDDGRPMLLAAAANLRSAMDDCVAVVESGGFPLATALRDSGYELHVCPASANGMGYSLAAGVASRIEASGWVILPGDMPWVGGGIIRGVVDALETGADCAAPRFRGRRGHPVGFSRRFRGALLQLRGDSGGRCLLEAAGYTCEYLDTSDPGVVWDVDRPGDLAKIQAFFRRRAVAGTDISRSR